MVGYPELWGGLLQNGDIGTKTSEKKGSEMLGRGDSRG